MIMIGSKINEDTVGGGGSAIIYDDSINFIIKVWFSYLATAKDHSVKDRKWIFKLRLLEFSTFTIGMLLL